MEISKLLEQEINQKSVYNSQISERDSEINKYELNIKESKNIIKQAVQMDD